MITNANSFVKDDKKIHKMLHKTHNDVSAYIYLLYYTKAMESTHNYITSTVNREISQVFIEVIWFVQE